MPKAWVVVNENCCKSCGLCVDACKPGILQIGEHLNPQGYHPVVCTDGEKCIGCAACAMVCPDAVIEVYRERKDSRN